MLALAPVPQSYRWRGRRKDITLLVLAYCSPLLLCFLLQVYMDENGVDVAAVFDDDTVSAAVATQQDDGAFSIEHYAMVWIAIIMTYYWGQQVHNFMRLLYRRLSCALTRRAITYVRKGLC